MSGGEERAGGIDEKGLNKEREEDLTFSTYSYVPTRLPLLMMRMEPTVLSGPWEEVRLASSQLTS